MVTRTAFTSESLQVCESPRTRPVARRHSAGPSPVGGGLGGSSAEGASYSSHFCGHRAVCVPPVASALWRYECLPGGCRRLILVRGQCSDARGRVAERALPADHAIVIWQQASPMPRAAGLLDRLQTSAVTRRRSYGGQTKARRVEVAIRRPGWSGSPRWWRRRALSRAGDQSRRMSTGRTRREVVPVSVVTRLEVRLAA